MMDNTKSQNQAVETMVDTFKNIQLCVTNIQSVSSSLEQVVTELVRSNEIIVNGVNTVSAVTEEVSARANETLAESKKNALIVEEISDTIISINDKAKKN